MDSPGGEPTIKVLGSAAGGGSPQWNCNCAICHKVRRRAPGTRRRTQASLAVSADTERWVLLNASPDLGEQLMATEELQPKKPDRHSPICAVVLTGGEIDEVTGLLTLRERQSFALYASQQTHDTLGQSPIFTALDPDLVPRKPLPEDTGVELTDGAGQDLGVGVESFAVPGKIPLYRETPGQTPEIGQATGDNIALRVAPGDRHFFYVPGCADITPDLKKRLDGAPLVFFDGTLWRDDELIASGLGQKTGQRMGHVSISGANGLIEELADVDIERRVLIHINNSNPVLLADSPQRQIVEDAGWEVAYDGMEINL